MKRILFLTLFGILAIVHAKSNTKLSYLYSNTNEIEVARIRYDKDATCVTFKTTRQVGPTFKIGHGIYIVGDDGIRHHAIGAEEIKLDSLYVLYKGQRLEFSVRFLPVPESNLTLDIICPGSFGVYGLHDSNVKLNIPKAVGKADNEETDFQHIKMQDTEIEGIIHFSDGNILTQVYCNSEAPSSYLREESTKYSSIDASGHFSAKFKMYTPQMIQLRDARLMNTNFSTGFIYVRPGDRISVEMNGIREGKGIAYTNHSGREAYNRLANCPWIPITALDRQKYIGNMTAGFVDYSYEQHYEMLMADYKKAMEYADYVCWHYCLSPYETLLYLNSVKSYYFNLLAGTDVYIKDRYQDTNDEEERLRYKVMLDKADYSYLKLLVEPNDVSLLYCDISPFGFSYQLYPIENCFGKVPENTPNRWRKIIELQQEELNRITGWTGRTFFMEMLIAKEVHKLFQHHISEADLADVKAMLSHPYCKQYVDIAYEEYKQSH
jgi:hypothetical protein